MTAVLMIVAGSYDAKILGFECRAEVTGDTMGLNATPVFAYAPHTGCVKTVALSPSGHLLASGSTDEHIKLYDLKRRKELGDLLLHEDCGAQGRLPGLAFHGKTHLLSSSEDGTVCVWRAKDWESLKVLKGHKQGINSLGLHPTGKLALSVSRDRTMRTWNLLKGRCAYITRLPAEATQVVWAPAGSMYATLAAKRATLYSIETAGEIGHVDSSFGPMQAGVFLGEDKVALGTDDGHLLVADVPGDGKAPRAIKLHAIRIKGLVAVASPFAPDCQWLVSAATDGSIKVWDVDALLGGDDDNIEEACILSVETRSRLTCLHAVSLVVTALGQDEGGVDLDDMEGQEAQEAASGSGEEEGPSDSDDDSERDGEDDDSEDTQQQTRKRPAPRQQQPPPKKHAPAQQNQQQQKQKAPQQKQKPQQQKGKPGQPGSGKAMQGKAGQQQGKQSHKGSKAKH